MDNMSCTEFEQSLKQAVETRSEHELRDLRDHAAACPICRPLWQRFTLLQQAIPLWKAQVPDVDLSDSVILRVAAGQPAAASRPARSSRLRWAVALTTAAAVCALAVILWPAPENRQVVESPQPPVVEPQQDDTPLEPVVAMQPAHEGAVRKGGDAIMVLAENAAGAVVKTPMFLPPASALSAGDTGQTDEAPASSWLAEWSQDLQPIGREVGNAMNFLLDAVPLEPAPTM